MHDCSCTSDIRHLDARLHRNKLLESHTPFWSFKIQGQHPLIQAISFHYNMETQSAALTTLIPQVLNIWQITAWWMQFNVNKPLPFPSPVKQVNIIIFFHTIICVYIECLYETAIRCASYQLPLKPYLKTRKKTKCIPASTWICVWPLDVCDPPQWLRALPFPLLLWATWPVLTAWLRSPLAPRVASPVWKATLWLAATHWPA